MFLLNDQLLNEYWDKELVIDHGVRANMHGTYYYFRLGGPYELWDEGGHKYITGDLRHGGEKTIVIPPNGFVKIKTKEYFRLSNKFLGILGPITNLLSEGLELLHSPFIDPLFRGHLDMAVKNLLNRKAELQLGSDIGKVAFFDISDTYPIMPPGTTKSAMKYKNRMEEDDYEDEPWGKDGSGHETVGDQT